MTAEFIYGHDYSFARDVILLYLLLVELPMGDRMIKSQNCIGFNQRGGMRIYLVVFSHAGRLCFGRKMVLKSLVGGVEGDGYVTSLRKDFKTHDALWLGSFHGTK